LTVVVVAVVAVAVVVQKCTNLLVPSFFFSFFQLIILPALQERIATIIE
jgi:hypothetical protein